MFDDKKIIRSHRMDVLEKINKSDIMDFLGNEKHIRTKRILANSQNDIDILKAWEDHFELYDIPYAIEQKGDELFLWKERRA